MVACLMEFERHAGPIGFMKKGEPLWGSCFMGLGRWGWSWILARIGSRASAGAELGLEVELQLGSSCNC